MLVEQQINVYISNEVTEMLASGLPAVFPAILNNWFHRAKQKCRNIFLKARNNVPKSLLREHCCAF